MHRNPSPLRSELLRADSQALPQRVVPDLTDTFVQITLFLDIWFVRRLDRSRRFRGESLDEEWLMGRAIHPSAQGRPRLPIVVSREGEKLDDGLRSRAYLYETPPDDPNFASRLARPIAIIIALVVETSTSRLGPNR